MNTCSLRAFSCPVLAKSSEDDYRYRCVYAVSPVLSSLERNVPSSLTHDDSSAALCKMPLLATDDSIITLRKSYYLGRAICEPRGNVVPACARERAGPIYLIMMLLVIMKDSGICRASFCAASDADNTIAKNTRVSTYILNQGR